jgi:hypothetical protein
LPAEKETSKKKKKERKKENVEIEIALENATVTGQIADVESDL